MDARTLCLGIINEQACSGYDIKKAVEEGPFQHFFSISFGSIYPTLNRLLDDGHIEPLEEAADSGGHPTKRRFRTTDLGRDELFDHLARYDTRDTLRSEFILALYFFDKMSVEERIAILDKRIGALDETLALMAQRMKTCPEFAERKSAILDFARHSRAYEARYLKNLRSELTAQRAPDARLSPTPPLPSTQPPNTPLTSTLPPSSDPAMSDRWVAGQQQPPPYLETL